MPIYVGMAPKGSALEFKLPSFGGNKRRDVLFFTQELSTLLNAGVPLDRSLSITAELTERASFRFIVLDVLRVLKGGRSLADSLATHPEYFSDLYINMVRAGEASGALAVIFERLAEFERSRDELRNYIISSMIYPALLACVGLTSIFILLNFVVPRFASIFTDTHMKMPTPTRLMLEASDLVHKYGWLAVGTVAGGWLAWRIYTRTTAGRVWWDGARLKLPLLGAALLKAETARFARAMATLVANYGAAGAVHRDRRRHVEQQDDRQLAGGRGHGREAGRRHRDAHAQRRRVSAAGLAPADRGRGNRPSGRDVCPHGRHLRK